MVLDETVKLAKQQILEDIASGVVPATVSTFGELHDYVDANEYGGLCDMMSDHRDENDDPAEWFCTFCNRVQDALHQWLVAGRGEVA
jgi:glycosyltransferase involved in cell wall biosynthesis